MKVGEIKQSFVYVKMVNDTEWVSCVDSEGKEFRYKTFIEAAGYAQDVARKYEGKEVILMKEHHEVFAKVIVDSESFRVKLKI